MSLSAITEHGPWGWAICWGGKDVENRGKPPPAECIGKWIAIHQGLTTDLDATEEIAVEFGLWPVNVFVPDAPEAKPIGLSTTGAVIGVARLVGWVQVAGGPGAYRATNWHGVLRSEAEAAAASRWNGGGPYLWVFREPRPLPVPVLCRGAQGWWQLPDDVEYEVRAQVRGVRESGVWTEHVLHLRDSELAALPECSLTLPWSTTAPVGARWRRDLNAWLNLHDPTQAASRPRDWRVGEYVGADDGKVDVRWYRVVIVEAAGRAAGETDHA